MTSLLEREGCTFADAATAGRARKVTEKADYPTLKQKLESANRRSRPQKRSDNCWREIESCAPICRRSLGRSSDVESRRSNGRKQRSHASRPRSIRGSSRGLLMERRWRSS
ncbi:unnamed protein product [Ectocarpus sp. CCAP 1310/34]|nr:unnamed protein product [Ectocarpus sp. CCAP 1310/34]